MLKRLELLKSWRSLFEEEAVAHKITSPFNNKLGCFIKLNYKDCFTKTAYLFVVW